MIILHQQRHFRQKQQMTIFAFSRFPTSGLPFFVFLMWFSPPSFFLTFANAIVKVHFLREIVAYRKVIRFKDST